MILKSEGTYRHRHTHALRPGREFCSAGRLPPRAGRVWSILISRISVKFFIAQCHTQLTKKQPGATVPGICMHMHTRMLGAL